MESFTMRSKDGRRSVEAFYFFDLVHGLNWKLDLTKSSKRRSDTSRRVARTKSEAKKMAIEFING